MISIPGRIPISIYPVFWLLVVMIGWLNSNTIEGTLIWGIIILFSVLIHEYGHALTAVAFGQKAEINLVGLGGVTKREGPDLSRPKEFLIVLNGPVAGFLLCLAAYVLSETFRFSNPSLSYALQVTFQVNLFWTILNLLPVLPLDGGHLLRILLEALFGFGGTRAALAIGILLGGFFAVFFFLYGQILIGALFAVMAFESYRAWAEARSITAEDRDEALQNTLREGMDAFRLGRPDEALAKFVEIRNRAPKGVLYVNATQEAARILCDQGKYKTAYEWLIPLQKRLSVRYSELLQHLSYRLEEWEKTVEVGEEVYRTDPNLETALLNARACAIMGKAEPTVGWLRCAILHGATNITQLVEKREFDAVRSTSVFLNWLRSIQ